jgi:hypothetical protein
VKEGEEETRGASLLYRSKSFRKKDHGRRKLFRKAEYREIANDHLLFIDYSDQKNWQDAISRIALSQQDYPKGVGVKISMDCMESAVRDHETRKGGYIYCSPQEIKVALRSMARAYKILKERKK